MTACPLCGHEMISEVAVSLWALDEIHDCVAEELDEGI